MPIMLGDGVLKITGDATPLEQALRSFTRTAGVLMLAAGAAIVGALNSSVAAAADFESAFAGIEKNLDSTGEKFDILKMQIRDMAEEKPVTASNLARIGELGAQLGITEEHIEGFISTIADLQTSTDLAGDSGVQLFAQLNNIAQVDFSEFSNVGAAIVKLGSTSFTTEARIINMSKRIAAAGVNAGMTIQEILALATSFASVGLEAELGGNSIARVINTMKNAVRGNDLQKLNALAAATGLTVDGFRSLFTNSPIEALQAFFQGLGQMEEAGIGTLDIMTDLQFQGIKLMDVVQRGGLAYKDLTEFIETSNREYELNNAHIIEAEKRNRTYNARLTMLVNTFDNLKISIGNIIKDGLLPYIEHAKTLIRQARDWVESNEEMATTIIKFAAALGTALIAVGALLISMPFLSTIFSLISAAIGLVSIKIVAIGALIAWLAFEFFRLEDVKTFMTEFWEFMVGIWDSISEDLMLFLVALKDLFFAVMGFLRDVVILFMETFAAGWLKAWRAIRGDSETLSAAIIVVIKILLQKMTDFVNKMTFVLNRWKLIFGLARIGIGMAIDDMKTKMTELQTWMLDMIEKVKGYYDTIVGWVQRAGAFISGEFQINVDAQSGTPLNRSVPSPVQQRNVVQQITQGGSGDKTMIVDLSNAVIKEEMDLDHILTRISSEWNINMQQHGMSTATVT